MTEREGVYCRVHVDSCDRIEAFTYAGDLPVESDNVLQLYGLPQVLLHMHLP